MSAFAALQCTCSLCTCQFSRPPVLSLCSFVPEPRCKETPPKLLHLLPLPLFYPSPFITRPVPPSRGPELSTSTPTSPAERTSPPLAGASIEGGGIAPPPRLPPAQVFSPPPPSRAEKDKSEQQYQHTPAVHLLAAPHCQTVVGGGDGGGGGQGGRGE